MVLHGHPEVAIVTGEIQRRSQTQPHNALQVVPRLVDQVPEDLLYAPLVLRGSGGCAALFVTFCGPDRFIHGKHSDCDSACGSRQPVSVGCVKMAMLRA